MFAKNSKTIFGVSLLLLVVAIILAAWGFPSIVNKQIQKVSLAIIKKYVNKKLPEYNSVQNDLFNRSQEDIFIV